MIKDTLTPETIERICRLNVCLTEAAHWIEERAERTRAAYFAGGGREDYQQCDIWEDYELEAIVKCSIGSDDQAFNPDDEYGNMIAVCETSLTHKESNDGSLKWSTPWDEDFRHSDIDILKETKFCYLFHEILEHTLHNDFDAIVRIGDIEINIVLTRQRGINLDTTLLPLKDKKDYPRSVFSATSYRGKRKHLTEKELQYAHLLNQKMAESSVWINEQARRCEKEYREVGGLDRHRENNAYEDYEMMMRVDCCLGENHPEYDESEDNIIATYIEKIDQDNQRVCGRSRNPLRYNRYGCYFSHGNRHSREHAFEKIQPCGLFWDIFRQIDLLGDWLKMLSIGQLWFDVVFMQRRIVDLASPCP